MLNAPACAVRSIYTEGMLAGRARLRINQNGSFLKNLKICIQPKGGTQAGDLILWDDVSAI